MSASGDFLSTVSTDGFGKRAFFLAQRGFSGSARLALAVSLTLDGQKAG